MDCVGGDFGGVVGRLVVRRRKHVVRVGGLAFFFLEHLLHGRRLGRTYLHTISGELRQSKIGNGRESRISRITLNQSARF